MSESLLLLVAFTIDSFDFIRIIFPFVAAVIVLCSAVCVTVCCWDEESKLSKLLILIKFVANKGLRSPVLATKSKLFKSSIKVSLSNIESVHCCIRPANTRSYIPCVYNSYWLYGVRTEAGRSWSIIDLTRVNLRTARRKRRITASRRRLRRWISLPPIVVACDATSNAVEAFLKWSAANKAGPSERWYGPRNKCKVSSRISSAVKTV